MKSFSIDIVFIMCKRKYFCLIFFFGLVVVSVFIQNQGNTQLGDRTQQESSNISFASSENVTLQTLLIDRLKMNFDSPPIKHVNDTKFILFWSRFYNMPTWGVPLESYGEDYLKSLNCSYTNCILTHKHDFLNNILDYDAVIIHGCEQFNGQLVDIPEVRSPHQLYIHANHE